jgi:hypothetical protein
VFTPGDGFYTVEGAGTITPVMAGVGWRRPVFVTLACRWWWSSHRPSDSIDDLQCHDFPRLRVGLRVALVTSIRIATLASQKGDIDDEPANEPLWM